MQFIPAFRGHFEQARHTGPRLSRVQVRYDDTGDFLFLHTGSGKSEKMCAATLNHRLGNMASPDTTRFLGYVVAHPGVWHDAPHRQHYERTRFDRVPSTLVQ